ncbi:MAG: MerR family transcriptional regulator [Clostridia bacterium]|nr:MerR family transcriptional regulator [Clostridia bacterium]
MMTVHEVSALTGVSIRALQYYDRIGLLPPAKRTEAGYRLYDGAALERLQQILLFRELEFPLKEISRIVDSPDFDRSKALAQQIELLTLKKEHLENLIDLARGLQLLGVNYMDFSAFDTKKIDEYARQAKAAWGNTPEYREFEAKAQSRTRTQDARLEAEMMDIFRRFAQAREEGPASEGAQQLVQQLRDFITANFYTCSRKVLSGLGRMYAGGGDFTQNIDSAAGEGTAAFVDEAIQIYCAK